MEKISKVTEMHYAKKIKELKGKNIVITGASSGIGKEVLDRLAVSENNNHILAASRTIEKLTGYGDNVTLFNCDISSK